MHLEVNDLVHTWAKEIKIRDISQVEKKPSEDEEILEGNDRNVSLVGKRKFADEKILSGNDWKVGYD